MSGTPKYEAVLSDLKRSFLRHAEDDFDFMVDPHASPIEKVFVAQMLVGMWQPIVHYGRDESFAIRDLLIDAGLEDDDTLPWFESPTHEYGWAGGTNHAAMTQPWLTLTDGRRIRPDVAFVLGPHYLTRVIVELDGHDFHERTPDQAQRDKSRDRQLQSMGWQVLRFTGREVLRDPWRCLQEVEALLRAKALADGGRLFKQDREKAG